ncbi:MAG: cytochrome c biogenesis protein CcdA [Bacteroidales bacterium]|jgi:thiol:disulfide interchange protein DsbD|nr:cytochrome c biogenesis protein CcdA [Bacteroidales bacterium]
MLKKIKIYVFLLIAATGAFNASAQIYDPATWEFSFEKTGDDSYEIVIKAEIERGSHIYSMEVPEGGPIPTSVVFDSLPGYVLEGDPWEVSTPEEAFDEAFDMNIKSFSGSAEFRQKISVVGEGTIVKGTVNYMACNNVTCSPPKDVEFELTIGSPPSVTGLSDSMAGMESSVPVRQASRLLGFFLISLLAGFAGVITPCVFPMIPMTVAFFSQGSESRSKSVIRALVFGLSIVLIYSLLGIIVSLTSAGAGIANALSTHWIPNIIFFLLFVIFAVSFFGAFEIVLPNRWVTGADSRVDRGGLLASFFLGLTTVIVSFSCTGPIIGVLLVEAASGDVLRPTIGMFGFGLAFALPFTIFALFPSVMNKIPRSGSWLNSVKVVLAFIMLAFSLKFLLTIDTVYSFRLLSRDIYLAIWIVLFSLLGFYLLGKIKFSHDSDLPHIGTFRLFLVIGVFAFTLYLVTGLFGAPLTGLSAMLPSPSESRYISSSQVPVQNSQGDAFIASSVFGSDLCSEPKHADRFTMPLGLKGYFDYEQGLACAREQGKPVLLDFKGHACANCKLMEARVWSDPGVLRRLRDNFVIISLYVDDRTQLPEEEWVTSAIDGKVKKTIGKVNEDLEISKFKTNALPLYVITDYEGNPVNDPMGTNMKAAEYAQWLDEGLAAFTLKNKPVEFSF